MSDLRFGIRVPGTKLAEDQALVFPTDYFEDPLPLTLLRCIAEYAKFSISNSLFFDVTEEESGGGIVETFEKVGPIEQKIVYSGSGTSGSGKASYPKVRKADSLARLLLLGGIGGVIR